MGSKAYLFTREGLILDEFNGVFKRSYKMNAVDKGSFEFRNLSPKAREAVFAFGNFIVIYNDGGLPPWGGRYDPDRSWGRLNFLSTIFSAEDQFNQRAGKPLSVPTLVTGFAGTAFRQLIKTANDQEDMLLREGEIYEGGKNTSIEISPATPLMSNIDALVKQSRQDWGIDPQVTDNQLTLVANWYKKRGRLLERGLNDKNCELDEDSLRETGPIFNQIFGYGTGDTWSARPIYVARDEESIKKYGLRSKPYSVQSDVSGTVQAATEKELERLAWPRKTYKAKVRYEPDVCELLRLGNILPYENPRAGFGSTGRTGVGIYVRLLAFAYKDGDRDVEATIQEEIVTV